MLNLGFVVYFSASFTMAIAASCFAASAAVGVGFTFGYGT
jgi:hypothetical protein